MFKEIISSLSFLTIIPIGKSDIHSISRNMHLFPLSGMIIGLIIGLSGICFSLLFDPLLVGLLTTILICIITGLHHMDGLSDFFDGVMTKGTITKKLHSVADSTIGIAGVSSIIFYVVCMTLVISTFSEFIIFKAFILSEIIAKCSMVLQATIGLSAKPGSNLLFITSMKNKKKLIPSIIFTVFISFLLEGTIGLLIIILAFLLTFLITIISNINFKGIIGDTFGTTNQLTQLLTLFVFVVI